MTTDPLATATLAELRAEYRSIRGEAIVAENEFRRDRFERGESAEYLPLTSALFDDQIRRMLKGGPRDGYHTVDGVLTEFYAPTRFVEAARQWRVWRELNWSAAERNRNRSRK